LSKLTIFVVGLDVVGFEVLGILVGLEDDDLTVHISTLSKQWQQLIAAGPILSLLSKNPFSQRGSSYSKSLQVAPEELVQLGVLSEHVDGLEVGLVDGLLL